MTSFIAVDLGTSFIKGAMLDLETLSLKHIQRVPFPEPVAGLPSLFYEVDPLQVVSAFQALVRQLLADSPDSQGLVMCSQMHGLVLTTEQGQPLSNCMTWQDQRVLLSHPSGEGTYFEILSSRLTAEEKRQIGNELKPSLPLCYLFWLAEENKLPQTAVIPAALPDFVLAYLSEAKPDIELTNAGAHGALNLETLAWHQGIIDKLGLAHLQWPHIRDFGEPVCTLEIDGASLPCYTPIGDHQCAVTGAFLGYEELSLNIATASQVTMLTPKLALGEYQTRPFFDSRFMNTIARLPAGRSLDVLINLLTELATAQGITLADPWATIDEAVASVSDTTLQVDLSFFATTVGDQGLIGNIQEDNLTIGHLFRAAFRHMAENYYTCGLRLSPNQGWRNLVFSGGIAQKVAPLRQIIQDKFGLDYRVCVSSEDTLLGLLALALCANGQAQSVGEATGILLERYE